MSTAAGKEILVYFPGSQISMLVPKKRGEGFQRAPLGHHVCPLSELAWDIGYDMDGLDGSLDVQTGWTGGHDQAHWIEKVVAPVAQLLGYSWRVVGPEEFWARHPLETKR